MLSEVTLILINLYCVLGPDFGVTDTQIKKDNEIHKTKSSLFHAYVLICQNREFCILHTNASVILFSSWLHSFARDIPCLPTFSESLTAGICGKGYGI